MRRYDYDDGRHEGTEVSDEFQSSHMASDDSVRHRDKRVSRGMAALLGIWAPFCWGLAAFIGVANATSSRPVPEAVLPFVLAAIALLGVMFLGMAVTFAVLRTVVTDTHLIVKYGLWGPEIALDSITACRVTDYDFTKFGGWGIRRGLGGKWAYVPGPGEVVEIEYTEDGVDKTVQVGAADARMLALEINRARQAPGLRIAEHVDDEIAQAKEEAALALEEEERERAARS
ncbi:MAG: hypothetical protein RIF41_01815 [Polyangiaceae bacterium]